MKLNIGMVDRRIRIAAGLIILIPHYIYYFTTGYYCVWANLGFFPLLTGFIKFCPLYLPFGFNTRKKQDSDQN